MQVMCTPGVIFSETGANYSMKFMCFDAKPGTSDGQLAPAVTGKGIRNLIHAGFVAITLLSMTVTSSAMAEGDAAAGAEKAHTCLGCHGIKHYVNTYPTYHVPKIAGQHEAYLVAALQAYRSKARSHPTMQANANLLSDQDIQDISAWFAAQGASSK